MTTFKSLASSFVLLAFLTLSESFNVGFLKSHVFLKSRSFECDSKDTTRTKLYSADVQQTTDGIVARKMGGFEKLLARITPNTKGEVSLSHGTAFVLKGFLCQKSLEDAVIHVLKRHEILRAYISSSRDTWLLSQEPLQSLASRIISTRTVDVNDFESVWQQSLDQSLNGPCFAATGPLWRLENIVASNQDKSAWVFTFNHALDDQQSVNSVVNDIIKYQSSGSHANGYISGGSSSVTSSGSRINENRIHNSVTFPFPPSIEEAIAPTTDIAGYSIKTLKWTFYQLLNGLAGAAVVPNHILKNYQLYLQQPTIATDKNLYHHYANPNERKTFCKIFELDIGLTEGIRKLSKLYGVSVAHTLSAAMLFSTAGLIQSFFIHDDNVETMTSDTATSTTTATSAISAATARASASSIVATNTKLRFLLSVSLRPFASIQYKQLLRQQRSSATNTSNNNNGDDDDDDDDDWAKNTIAAAAGALDYITTVPSLALDYLSSSSSSSSSETSIKDENNSNNNNNSIKHNNNNTIQLKLSKSNYDLFWSQAKQCSEKTKQLMEQEFVPESVRLFGLGMSIPGLDILKAVENDAAGTAALGRSYSCGVSNVGVVNYASSSSSSVSSSVGDNSTPSQQSLSVERAYYGTSHGRNGVLSLLSTMTINQSLNGCLQFTNPLTTSEEADNFRQMLIALLTSLVAFENGNKGNGDNNKQ